MKQRKFLTGILSLLVLGFGLVFTGGGKDDDDGGGSPLEGTWNNKDGSGQIRGSVTFTGSNYSLKNLQSGTFAEFENGIFTYTSTSITFERKQILDPQGGGNMVTANAVNTGGSVTYSWTYSITSNNLILNGTTYTK